MTEDNSWVFDSLVCFLHGPVWNAPLQTFIEEKSLIFDPNEQIDEKNPEFKKIHDDYKNLVDFMLGSFMEEMQITPEQFEVACLEGRYNNGTSASNGTGPGNPSFSFHHGLFQQIWAANDFRIFIRMMTQRNVELQLQALDLIERRQNSDKESDDIRPDILKATEILDEHKLNGGFNDDDDHRHFNTKLIPDDISSIKEQKNNLIDIDDDEDVDNEKIEELNNDKFDDSNVDEKFQRLNLFFEREHIDSADVKSRQEYLRNQRDKILEIKKKARTRQLNESVKKNGRPSSAQFAQKIMDGEIESVNAEPPEASLLLRKTLAKRLRTEVVNPDEK